MQIPSPWTGGVEGRWLLLACSQKMESFGFLHSCLRGRGGSARFVQRHRLIGKCVNLDSRVTLLLVNGAEPLFQFLIFLPCCFQRQLEGQNFLLEMANPADWPMCCKNPCRFLQSAGAKTGENKAEQSVGQKVCRIPDLCSLQKALSLKQSSSL